MDQARVFLYTIREINRYLNTQEPYEYIKACGLLRLLFLDSPNLVDVVNKEYRIKIRFNTGNSMELPPSLKRKMVLSIRTLKPFWGAGRMISLDNFLAMDALSSNGYDYTVKEIISFCANKLGGIHYDKLSEAKDINLRNSFAETMEASVLTLGYGYIHEICEISLIALQPLTDQIDSNNALDEN